MNPKLVSAKTPGESDSDLLSRISGGDLSALGALFDRHGDGVRRLLARLGVGSADLDDLVQLTFLDAARIARNYDGRENAKPWLSGLAIMTARRHRRSVARVWNQVRHWALEPRVAHAPSAEDTFELMEAAAEASKALAGLSTKKREVFVMVVVEEMSGEEAARALGIPVATVWTRLHHARRDLRDALAREDR